MEHKGMGQRSREETTADDDQLPPEEAARRRDEALRRLLNTPPQPQKGKAAEKKGDRDKEPGRPERKPSSR